RHQRGKALLGIFETEHPPQNEKQTAGKTHEGDKDTDIGQHAQRQVRKTEQTVERIAHETAKRLLRLTGGAVLSVVQHIRGGKSNPGAEAREKTMSLGQIVEGFDGGAPEKAKGAGVGLDGIIGQPPENAVEKIEANAT